MAIRLKRQGKGSCFTQEALIFSQSSSTSLTFPRVGREAPRADISHDGLVCYVLPARHWLRSKMLDMCMFRNRAYFEVEMINMSVCLVLDHVSKNAMFDIDVSAPSCFLFRNSRSGWERSF